MADTPFFCIVLHFPFWGAGILTPGLHRVQTGETGVYELSLWGWYRSDLDLLQVQIRRG